MIQETTWFTGIQFNNQHSQHALFKMEKGGGKVGGVTATNRKAHEQLGKSKLDPSPPQKAFEWTHLAKHHSAKTENLTATGICSG